MKTLILFLLTTLVACTQKYADYDLISKADFDAQNYRRPTPVKTPKPGVHDELYQCYHQWLFFSNAEKQKEEGKAQLVKMLCPNDDYLVDTTMTDRWWTILLYTQACVDIETFCPKQETK